MNLAALLPSQAALKSNDVNVGDVERAASLLAGGGLLLSSIRNLDSVGGVARAIAGGAFIYRGLSGNCKLYSALGLNTNNSERTGVPAKHGTRVEDAIFIAAEPGEIYSFWRDLTNLPRFLNHVEAVEESDGNRSHWKAQGPLGITAEWDAEIINEEPGRLIAWRSLPSSRVDTAGSVRFEPRANGTQVIVSLKYDPPAGRLGIALAHLLGEAPEQQLAADLYRLKRVIEAGEAPNRSPENRVTQKVQTPPPSLASLDDVEQASAESFPASDAPSWTATSAHSANDN